MIDPTELFKAKRYAECAEALNELYNKTTNIDQKNAIKMNLSKCFYYLKRPDLAEVIIDNLCKDISDPLLRVDLAMYKNAQGKFDEAFNILKNLPLEYDQVAFNLGWHLVREGKFKAGFDLMNRGRNLNVFGNLHFYKIDYNKIYTAGNYDRIALLMEGGIGDQILFIRWAKHINKFCRHLDVYCDSGLVDIFKNMGLNAIDVKFFVWATYDALVPSMAIPSLFNIHDPKEYTDKHYLKLDVNTSRFKLDEDFKIGIKYIGNTEFEHDLFRQLPPSMFDNMHNYGQIYDLQMDHNLAKNATKITDKFKINTWMDTYGIIDNLNLVVSCCTGIAHLSAAMGKKTVIMLPLVSYFVWGGQSWYDDNVVIIRQDTFDDWDNVNSMLYKFLDRNLA